MKKILLVSKEWSPVNNTGLGYSATNHEKILKENKIKVFTIGPNDTNKDFSLKIKNLIHFILNFKKNLNLTTDIIEKEKPDVIIVESLQTIFSEIFLYCGFKHNIKTIIVSHGISIFPYKKKIKYFFRYFLWAPYIFLLNYLIKKCDIFLTLNIDGVDNRNFDRVLAEKNDREIIEYNNFSRFENVNLNKHDNKNDVKIILCIGYINHIKNQIDLVKIANKIQDLNVKIKIIFNFKNQNYYRKILSEIKKNNLNNIILQQEKEVVIQEEINNCWFLINTSITEVSPLSLIEGNAMEKFFLSYRVGNLYKFKGRIINYDIEQIIFNVRSLYNNNFFNKNLKKSAKNDYISNFSKKNCSNVFFKILNKI